MPFQLLHDLLPEIAERETRTVILPKPDGRLPAGAYSYLDMFCNEPGCDCRRVFLMVLASFRKDPQAVIAWGWEELAFYERWIKYGDKADAVDLQGPALNLGSEATELAPALLALFRKVLLADPEYVARVKRHYAAFRTLVDAGEQPPKPIPFPSPRTRGNLQDTRGAADPAPAHPGQCLLCQATIPKAEASRHVKACLAAQPKENGAPVRLMRFMVESRGLPQYWLLVEVPGSQTLKHLDAFLRGIWLECCDHLSAFTIAKTQYVSERWGEGAPDSDDRTMNVELRRVLDAGQRFNYEYDFGSTTALTLRAVGIREAPWPSSGTRLLARNLAPEVRCAACGAPATKIHAGGFGFAPEACFCDTCSGKKETDEGMWLPLVNSPRTGVCAYCG